jgi:hypothetical protein
MAIELELGEDVLGSGSVGSQFVGVVAIGRHGDAPSLDAPAWAAFKAIA